MKLFSEFFEDDFDFEDDETDWNAIDEQLDSMEFDDETRQKIEEIINANIMWIRINKILDEEDDEY